MALPQVLKLDSPGHPLDFFDAGDPTTTLWGLASPTTPRQDDSASSPGGGEDAASFMPFSPSRFGVHARRTPNSANSNLTVRPPLRVSAPPPRAFVASGVC